MFWKNHNIILQIYSNIILVISFAVAYDKINYNVFNHIWIIILVFISYCYAFYKNLKFEVYEIISFVITNIFLAVIFNKFELYDYIKYIFFITTIIITTLQYFSKRLQNISTKVYLVTSFILAFISLNVQMNLLSFVAILVLGAMFYCYINPYLKPFPQIRLFKPIIFIRFEVCLKHLQIIFCCKLDVFI